MAFDWRNDLFQGSEKLRGLSGGGAGAAVALDESNSFYNFRLRRHYTDELIAEHPERLWFTNDDPAARTGLGPHVAEALSAGHRFTDILVVLSDDDWDAALDADPHFEQRLVQRLRAAHDDFVKKGGGRGAVRPVGFWIVRDGAEVIGGQSFGLVEGEFITGIVPNLYRIPGPSSRPILAFLVNIPGAWEGYREIGRLYDDQVLFTLGDHWLDNFRHPHLREAALYRLQRGEDGAFFHLVNPDLQDRYHVTSTDQAGTSVITLATSDGEPLAYIVVVVVEAADEPDLSFEERPTSTDLLEIEPIGELDEIDDLPPLGLDFVEGPLLEPVVMPSASRGAGSRTIVPEAHNERIFTLQERGALLQKVHFSGFMLGYDVYVGPRGELGTVVDAPSATFQVRKKTVSLLANAEHVRLDGERVPAGESRLIEGDAVVQVGNQRFEYRELRQEHDDEGWPYVGEIRRPASSTYMLWGRAYPIGRSRDCRIVLPDEPRNDNIVWKPKIGEGSTIKSKTGEIPKSRFYTDSIMVASEHAAIELLEEVPYLVSHARHCFSYIRRNGRVLTIWPTEASRDPRRLPLEPGDEVLIGNILFHVGFSASAATSVVPAPAPQVMSTSSLVDAVSVHGELEPAPIAFGLSDDLDIGLGGLPDIAAEDAPPPPAIDASAESRLRAPRRSWPEADAGLLDLEDPPPPPRIGLGARGPSKPVFAAETRAALRNDEPTPRPIAARAPVGAPAPTAAIPPVASREVVVVDDHDAQFELGRPARLVLVGWAVNGSVTCGNHTGCELVVPESRLDASQSFEPKTYFELRVRGKKGRLGAVDAAEVRVDGEVPDPVYEELGEHVVSVIRRDEDGDVDFTVDLTIGEDDALPDPRARLVAIDPSEPLALALFTRGFPVRAPRPIALHGLAFTGIFDGHSLEIADYLDHYRTASGFQPFFVKAGPGRFRTAPEDGSPIRLAPGDRIAIGGAVWRFDVV